MELKDLDYLKSLPMFDIVDQCVELGLNCILRSTLKEHEPVNSEIDIYPRVIVIYEKGNKVKEVKVQLTP